MALRKPGKNRAAGATNGPVSRTPLGGARNAQIVTTYGVGAMVAIEDHSYIVSGLDTWKIDGESALYEPRLQRRLGVRAFHSPPADEPPSGDGIRVRRFPTMYTCPDCNDLKEFKHFGATAAKGKCVACDRALVPSRFVIACENGHLDDFPYWQWVHRGNPPESSRHELKLHSDGRTASLRSVIVECSCGLRASMEGAFGRKALGQLKLRCGGRRPWLGDGAAQNGCDAAPRTLQRGASAAWFAVNRSSLSIPPWSKAIQKHVDKNYKLLSHFVAQSNAADAIENAGVLDGTPFSVEHVIDAVRRQERFATADATDAEPVAPLEAATPFRMEEYDPLYYGTAHVDHGDDFECAKPDATEEKLPSGIGRSMLVKRLREVRALESFTRVEAPDALPDRKRHAALSKDNVDWLPAIDVSGEGVFLALDQDRLATWESAPEPSARARTIRERHTRLLQEQARKRGETRSPQEIRSPISARYVLLHTLAHALINEWSLDAGYPAASLRERLYVADDRAGILIYTATSDSAGSLGGVVAQGEHRRLKDSLESAMSRITWCSQDPPCMESEAGGADSLNLAACYACVMVPESSCEANNTFLDRALLLGTPENSSTGFFADLGTV